MHGGCLNIDPSAVIGMMSSNNTTAFETGMQTVETGSTGFGVLIELICVWMFCGNIIIIIVLTLYKPLAIPDLLVFSLAFSDLLNVLFPAQMLNIIPNLLKTTWSRPLCILFTSSTYWVRISSVLTISVISLDRLIAVQKPLVYRSTVMHEITRIKLLLIGLWLLSLLLATLPYMGFGHTGYHEGSCHYQLIDLGLAYGILIEIVGLVQAALVLYCYIGIKVSTGNFMKRQDKFCRTNLDRTVSSQSSIAVQKTSKPAKNTMRRQSSTLALTGADAVEESVAVTRESKGWIRRTWQSKRHRQNNAPPLTVGMRQVAKMEKLMATLVFLFYFSWLPFLVSFLYL